MFQRSTYYVLTQHILSQRIIALKVRHYIVCDDLSVYFPAPVFASFLLSCSIVFPPPYFLSSPIVIHCGLTLWSLFPLSGTVCPAGSGQLPLGPGWPSLWGPGPPDQRAELCWLEHRQGPQGPEGCGRDPYWAGGQRQVRGNWRTLQW